MAASWANALVTRVNAHLQARAVEESERSLVFLREELERTRVAEVRDVVYRLIESQMQRAMIANAGSTGTSARSTSLGMLMGGVGRIDLPSNWGSHCLWASSISLAISLISLRVHTAPVKGSIARAWTTASGSPKRAASAVSSWTFT